MHIQGCGDFNIGRIEVADPPCSSGRQPTANEAQTMDMAGSGARLLAVADLAARQGVVRLNTPDPLAGEQTWPTNEVSSLCRILGILCACAVTAMDTARESLSRTTLASARSNPEHRMA